MVSAIPSNSSAAVISQPTEPLQAPDPIEPQNLLKQIQPDTSGPADSAQTRLIATENHLSKPLTLTETTQKLADFGNILKEMQQKGERITDQQFHQITDILWDLFSHDRSGIKMPNSNSGTAKIDRRVNGLGYAINKYTTGKTNKNFHALIQMYVTYLQSNHDLIDYPNLKGNASDYVHAVKLKSSQTLFGIKSNRLEQGHAIPTPWGTQVWTK